MLDPKNLKPSTVLEAMINGLLKSKADPLFVIDMSSYGHVEENDFCYGCCASVALVDMFGGGKSPSELMLAYSHAKSARYTNISNVIELNSIYQSTLLEYGEIDTKISNAIELNSNSTPINLEELEIAIDGARRGEVSILIRFLTGVVNRSFDRWWNLENHNWEEQLPKVKLAIARMIDTGC